MTQVDIVTRLKKEVASNEIANSILTSWALRERSRYTVTTSGIVQRMKIEGYPISKAQCEPFLELLATMGLGKLQRNARGRITGLTEVKMTLQSIGLAAIEKASLEGFKKRAKFSKLVTEATQAPRQGRREGLQLVISVSGKPVQITIPEELSDADISYLVRKFMHKESAA